MSGYQVEPGDLQHADGSFAATVAGSRDALAGLRHAADALLEGGWQGVAALSFRRAWMQWFSGTVSMLDALDAMAAALGAAGADYALTEAAVRASVVRAE